MTGRGRLGGGYCRHDLKTLCPGGCGRKLRPCNLLRHLEARHPDLPFTAALRHDKDTAKLRMALSGRYDART